MSKDVEDFLSGFNVTELDRETAEKALEINEFIQDSPHTRKEGKAATGRMAVILGHQFLQIIEEAEEEEKKDVKDVLDVKKRMVNML